MAGKTVINLAWNLESIFKAIVLVYNPEIDWPGVHWQSLPAKCLPPYIVWTK